MRSVLNKLAQKLGWVPNYPPDFAADLGPDFYTNIGQYQVAGYFPAATDVGKNVVYKIQLKDIGRHIIILSLPH